jgi:hypothetical protein
VPAAAQVTVGLAAVEVGGLPPVNAQPVMECGPAVVSLNETD